MLHIGYLSPSVIALVHDFTFVHKKNVIPSSDVRGRHDCFRFRKHPSSFTMLKQETSSTTLSCIDGLEVSHQTVMIEVRGLGFDFRLWQGLYSC